MLKQGQLGLADDLLPQDKQGLTGLDVSIGAHPAQISACNQWPLASDLASIEKSIYCSNGLPVACLTREMLTADHFSDRGLYPRYRQIAPP